MAPRGAQRTAAGTGRQPSSRGVLAGNSSLLCGLRRSGPIQTGAKRDEGARLTQKQVLRRSSTSNCRQRVVLVLLADGRNTWAPSSPSQELGRRDACSGVLTFSRPSGQTGDLPEECRFLLKTQMMFMRKEKDPTTKQFDDDWIRSLTDVPEDSVTHDQQDVDLQRVRPIQMAGFLRRYVSRRLLALSEGEVAALATSIAADRSGHPRRC